MSYSKYYIYKRQYSDDNGATWHDVYPAETEPGGEPIGTYDTLVECEGEIPPIPSDYSERYFTLVPTQNKTSFRVLFSSESTLYYSINSGLTWTSIGSNGVTPEISVGNMIMWKGDVKPVVLSGGGIEVPCIIRSNNNLPFNAEGNTMSLIYDDDFIGKTDLKNTDKIFTELLSGSKVVNAENMVLPATALTTGCYASMFQGCTSLTTAPSLPSTELANYCYWLMFYGCTSLTTAPELSATTLEENCYASMFQGCTSLTTTPSLPATTLASGCYAYMFAGCTSLTTAPSLPATTLDSQCYDGMFYTCTSLIKAPDLLAATLVSNCYMNMFTNCTNLSSIKCLGYNPNAGAYQWVRGVSATGTFTKKAGVSWPTGNNGIPNGWTVVEV